MQRNPKSFSHRIGRTVWRHMVEPFSASYRPPEYEALWGSNKTLLYRALTPMRRIRGEKLFRQSVRPTDVFIIGHPKSGNTWVAYMYAVLTQRDSAEVVTMANVGNYVPTIHGNDLKIAEHEDLPDPRAFRTEWPLFPEHYPKIIYLVRDPRAALVSYYNMFRAIFPKQSATMDEFIDEYMRHGEIPDWEPLVRWDRQVLSWVERSRRDPSVIVVKYEDMVKDRRAELERIASFAGMQRTDQEIELAVQRGSFEAMRANESRHGAESYQVAGKGGQFVRKGKVDGWKEELSPECAALIEHEFKTAMEAVGYA